MQIYLLECLLVYLVRTVIEKKNVHTPNINSKRLKLPFMSIAINKAEMLVTHLK